MRKKKIIEEEKIILRPEVQSVLDEVQKIISVKKIIAPDIKDKLIELGFKEVVIGYKREHEITSKQVKIDFFGYDIAIGLSAISINYGCGRRYRALAIKIEQKL